MGYFPNSTAHDIYVDRLCRRCQHWTWTDNGQGHTCPVMDLHWWWNRLAIDDPDKRRALELFIPMPEDGSRNEDCTMFAPDSGGQDG